MFDDESSWDQAFYHLRLLSLKGSTCYFPFRMANGRIHRSTLRRLSELARPLLPERPKPEVDGSPLREDSGAHTKEATSA